MPFDGYLKDILVKPGDKVKAGQLLIQLDDADLVTKRAHAKAERAQKDAEYQFYSSKQDKQAEAKIALAERDGAEADYQYYDNQVHLAQHHRSL